MIYRYHRFLKSVNLNRRVPTIIAPQGRSVKLLSELTRGKINLECAPSVQFTANLNEPSMLTHDLVDYG